MSKHMSEPWRVFGSSAVNGTSNEIRAGGKLIARVFHNGDVFEREANARLIAAAPELLEALQLVRDYIVTMKQAGHEYSVAVDTAIAKAIGEHHDN